MRAIIKQLVGYGVSMIREQWEIEHPGIDKDTGEVKENVT